MGDLASRFLHRDANGSMARRGPFLTGGQVTNDVFIVGVLIIAAIGVVLVTVAEDAKHRAFMKWWHEQWDKTLEKKGREGK